MTPSELKFQVERHGQEPYYFSRETMKFFGDTMRNYGVRSRAVRLRDCSEVEVWELYRKRPVKYSNWASAYFDKETFARVFAEDGGYAG